MKATVSLILNNDLTGSNVRTVINRPSNIMKKAEETGRYYIVDEKTGRKFCVEPIGNPRTDFGDINPATGKIEGDYGMKYRGSIDEKDSIITEENGFKDIGYAKNPLDYVEDLLKK